MYKMIDSGGIHDEICYLNAPQFESLGDPHPPPPLLHRLQVPPRLRAALIFLFEKM